MKQDEADLFAKRLFYILVACTAAWVLVVIFFVYN